ncbi:MAG: chitobiase/beta-hexosaminidase C-terminal domain-containing protein [Bacteroidales bacterium]|nr:chitobiase/beta-hexosaminidase C-terminal domain-containing protein [Bacteroidales bacterium]
MAAFALSAQTFNTRLLPSPQRVERAEGFLTGSYPVQHRMVSSIGGAANQDLAYRLIINASGVMVEYVDLDGYEYGMRTLERLAEAWHDSLPCMTLTDWPAFRYRGFLDDVSRGPIPSRQFALAWLEKAERLQFNANTYYTEHTFYSDSMPDVAPLSARSLPTAADHPSLIPNLQCLAHYEKVLSSPFYADMMDTPATLNPAAEETYGFLKQRLNEVARANLKSSFFHINADETEALGSGRARRYVDSLGADEVYCRHIKRVAKMLRNYGFRLLMWGDIVAKKPSMIGQLPSSITYVAWMYGPQASYAEALKPFADQRVNFWVAASVSQSGTVAPDPEAWIKNIAFLARDGHAAGADGFTITAWDDAGEALFGACPYAMAWAAEMAWHPIEATDPDAADAELAYRWRQFELTYTRYYGPREPTSLRALQSLRRNADVGDWFDVPALYEPLPERPDTLRAARVIAAIDSLPADSLTPHALYALHRIRLTARKQLLAAALASGSSPEIYEQEQRAFMQSLLDLKREYLHLWDAECTDHWRDVVAARYDALGRQVLQAPYRVRVHLNGRAVELSTPLGGTDIYYTLDGSTPSRAATPYTAPFEPERSCVVKTVAYNQWGEPVYSEHYLPVHKALGAKVKLGHDPNTYREVYRAGGIGALTDGQLGSDIDYADGHWQGFQGCDLDAALDLGSTMKVETVSMRFLQFSRDWILSPRVVELYTSSDGRHWQLAHTEHLDPDWRCNGPVVQPVSMRRLGLRTRHLRVVARYAGVLPQWHPSAGQPSYIFCDEIMVNDK